ncbi:hypothetical protein [Nocardiopsis sp. HUAS JQ3]|uniref:hypothetical protein n=1 Tax=Nocardiopsis sp. HUAS JQ3 TaxID=3061629 RepID=UPI0023A9DF48|nr:hypothetical protein [Nocardiopsis sp. HUAS JQ3]WDZ91172.1 hypothetical protein PV789_00920 [Nocardiopsis sp. HUAS JQ3]
MTATTAELLLPAFVTAALSLSIWLGFLLGSETLLLAGRRWRHWRAVARRTERELAEVTAERDQFAADRAELVAQLAEAEAALGRVTQGSEELLAAIRAQGRHHAAGGAQ